MKNRKMLFGIAAVLMAVMGQVVFAQSAANTAGGDLPGGKETAHQEQEAEFVLANGTGDSITEIEIRPSQKKYRGNKNVCALTELNVPDTAVFAVSLPPQMKSMDSFDLIIKYGKKTAKTKQSIVLKKNGANAPLFVLSIKGKDSTIPLIAGGTGAGATAAGIGITAAALKAGAAWALLLTNSGTFGGAAALAEALTMIGSSMVGGIAVVAAAPVVVGGGIFAAVMLLSAKTLIATPIDFVAD